MILYVAYPLLTVSEMSAGGAEQILWTLEREMAGRGVQTTVAASAGSQVSGELFVTGEPCSLPDDFERRNREHQDRVVELVCARSRQGRGFDLVHDQSGSFWPRAAEINVPLLATLHLPRSFYSAELFSNVPENVFFNCVSHSQACSFADLNPLELFQKRFIPKKRNPDVQTVLRTVSETCGGTAHRFSIAGYGNSGNALVILNGIVLDQFEPNFRQRRGVLWLGRICEEKAPHLALEVAAAADEPITLAGQVYPFSYHQQYFEREVFPRLVQMPEAQFIPSPSAEQKRALLRECKAVLITSLAEETSSLVAMEAAASGTPVVAFRRGALPEIVREGVTGLLVDSVEEAVEALKQIESIDPAACVAYARQKFNINEMVDGYGDLYRQIRACFKNMLGKASGGSPGL